MTEAREMTASPLAPDEEHRWRGYVADFGGFGWLDQRRIWATLDASRAREKAPVEALRWYADPANWRAQGHPQIDADTIPAHRDRGIRARAVFILKPLDGSPSPADMPSDCHPQGE